MATATAQSANLFMCILLTVHSVADLGNTFGPNGFSIGLSRRSEGGFEPARLIVEIAQNVTEIAPFSPVSVIMRGKGRAMREAVMSVSVATEKAVAGGGAQAIHRQSASDCITITDTSGHIQ